MSVHGNAVVAANNTDDVLPRLRIANTHQVFAIAQTHTHDILVGETVIGTDTHAGGTDTTPSPRVGRVVSRNADPRPQI